MNNKKVQFIKSVTLNDERKINISDPVLVAQSTTEPVQWGGYQLPDIRCAENKDLYIKFAGRKDAPESSGKENKDPVYVSSDKGVTWQLSDIDAWHRAMPTLPNGDKFSFGENDAVPLDIEMLPKTEDDRTTYDNALAFTIDEINQSGVVKIEKTFKCYRIYNGTNEVKEEICNVRWDNMPIVYYPYRSILFPVSPRCGYRVDKNGVMWMTVHLYYFDDDKKLYSNKESTMLLRSDDFGHNWDYVSTIIYEDRYNHPNSKRVEGFNETAMEILDDGSIIVILRTGSLHPVDISTEDNPFPHLYIVKSTDGGKTWTEPKIFHDFGIRPRSVMMPDGTIVFLSGRPGFFLKVCHDPKGESWSEPLHISTIPKEDIYNAYHKYTCNNTGLCVYDEKNLFMTYSDFTLKSPDGEDAKSILVLRMDIQ